MSFADLDVPMKRALDVANIGIWGNGSVQITVTSSSEVPYALSLSRLRRPCTEQPFPVP